MSHLHLSQSNRACCFQKLDAVFPKDLFIQIPTITSNNLKIFLVGKIETEIFYWHICLPDMLRLLLILSKLILV